MHLTDICHQQRFAHTQILWKPKVKGNPPLESILSQFSPVYKLTTCFLFLIYPTCYNPLTGNWISHEKFQQLWCMFRFCMLHTHSHKQHTSEQSNNNTSPPTDGFNPRLVHVGFLVDKLALQKCFSVSTSDIPCKYHPTKGPALSIMYHRRYITWQRR